MDIRNQRVAKSNRNFTWRNFAVEQGNKNREIGIFPRALTSDWLIFILDTCQSLMAKISLEGNALDDMSERLSLICSTTRKKSDALQRCWRRPIAAWPTFFRRINVLRVRRFPFDRNQSNQFSRIGSLFRVELRSIGIISINRNPVRESKPIREKRSESYSKKPIGMIPNGRNLIRENGPAGKPDGNGSDRSESKGGKLHTLS